MDAMHNYKRGAVTALCACGNTFTKRSPNHKKCDDCRHPAKPTGPDDGIAPEPKLTPEQNNVADFVKRLRYRLP
jgi:hypothetical protein